MNQDLSNQVKQLIGKNKTKEAILLLESEGELEESELDTLAIQKARLERMTERKRNDSISEDHFSQELNRINKAVLEIGANGNGNSVSAREIDLDKIPRTKVKVSVVTFILLIGAIAVVIWLISDTWHKLEMTNLRYQQAIEKLEERTGRLEEEKNIAERKEEPNRQELSLAGTNLYKKHKTLADTIIDCNAIKNQIKQLEIILENNPCDE